MQWKTSTMFRNIKAKWEWCFSRLTWKKICAADAITSYTGKKSTNNEFRTKQTTNKVPHNIVRGFEVRTKVRLMFWTWKESMKGKCYIFSCYKRKNNVRLVYLLEGKLQIDRYGWCILKLTYKKTVEITYLEKSKIQTRYGWCS